MDAFGRVVADVLIERECVGNLDLIAGTEAGRGSRLGV
jgi:hypothetical protein